MLFAFLVKIFTNDLALSRSSLAIGDRYSYLPRTDVYISNGLAYGHNAWSVQQKLYVNDSYSADMIALADTRPLFGADVYFGEDKESLLMTMVGTQDTGATYLFRTPTADDDGLLVSTATRYWSLQQILKPSTPPDLNEENNTFGNPAQYGSNMLFVSNNNTIELKSQFHNGSCLLLWLTDHFGDGWDKLVLTVRAPDVTNDSFSPMCSQINPFQIRYCPYKPQDEGVYIVQTFAPWGSRFPWEVSWQV